MRDQGAGGRVRPPTRLARAEQALGDARRIAPSNEPLELISALSAYSRARWEAEQARPGVRRQALLALIEREASDLYTRLVELLGGLVEVA